MNKQAEEFLVLAARFRAAGDEQQAAHFDGLAGRYIVAEADTPARRLDTAEAPRIGTAKGTVRFDAADPGHAERQALADRWRLPLAHQCPEKRTPMKCPVAQNTSGSADSIPLNERGPDTEPQRPSPYADAWKRPLQHSTRDLETNAPNPAQQYAAELAQKASGKGAGALS